MTEDDQPWLPGKPARPGQTCIKGHRLMAGATICPDCTALLDDKKSKRKRPGMEYWVDAPMYGICAECGQWHKSTDPRLLRDFTCDEFAALITHDVNGFVIGSDAPVPVWCKHRDGYPPSVAPCVAAD
jgi:hypothetical protein